MWESLLDIVVCSQPILPIVTASLAILSVVTFKSVILLSITALEAMKEYGIMRLSSRVCELKNQGYLIRSEFISSKNRYNELVSFSKYSLI